MSKLMLPWVAAWLNENEFLTLSESTAIVGSSGKLIQQNLGGEIDDCVDVVRFNRAPTDGFELFVGSRTTLRVLNNCVFDNAPIQEGWATGDDNFARRLRKTEILYIGSDLDPIYNWKQNVHGSNKLWFFPYQFVGQLQAAMGLEKHPSVGMAVVSLCVCAGIKPKLFGFDVAPGERTWYYGTRPSVAGPHHNVNQEQLVLKALHKEGKVILK